MIVWYVLLSIWSSHSFNFALYLFVIVWCVLLSIWSSHSFNFTLHLDFEFQSQKGDVVVVYPLLYQLLSVLDYYSVLIYDVIQMVTMW